MIKKLLLFTVLTVFVLGSAVSALAVESTFHGQFRINYYSLSQEADVGDGVAAARLRWRPTWDVMVSKDVSMHMQLNIGHIESNTSNARYDKSIETKAAHESDPAVALRHAMLLFTTTEIGGKFAAGLVPVSDKFGDTLFSSDWDFNPLTFAWLGKVRGADIRLATAKLMEKDSEVYDDVDAYVADVDLPMGNGSVGGSVYVLNSGDAVTALGDLGGSATQNYIGIRASQNVDIVKLNGFILWNTGKIESCTICTGSGAGKDVDNSGYAIKLEGMVPLSSANIGVMFLTTSGDKDFLAADSASSFITPMTLIAHTGYWGYTGKLNVQGPTDTGIDNPLNIDGAAYSTGSGVGYGIMTLQAKADFPIMDRLTGYAAIGIFQHQDVPSGFDKSIGTDIYLQGKYNVAQNLNLEAGLDYASIGKDNKAYGNSVDNTVTLLFARLQLEY
ncbi:MAG: hypothetical protein HZA12_02695 [Nitrospirae bacterium]|nr:hypothetical protein [Nitrospirota bacterium]